MRRFICGLAALVLTGLCLPLLAQMDPDDALKAIQQARSRRDTAKHSGPSGGNL